jgi:hypothetical protein
MPPAQRLAVVETASSLCGRTIHRENIKAQEITELSEFGERFDRRDA